MGSKHITEKERYKIEVYYKENKSVPYIAEQLGRNKQTIYNEIKRGLVTLLNSDLTTRTEYLADYAQNNYEMLQSNKGRHLKIGNDLEYVKWIEEKVKEKYSFYALLHLPDNDKFKTNICETTLYNYYHGGVFLNLTKEDMPYKKSEKKKNDEKRKVALHNLKARSIEERPNIINERVTYGHWEMDTVVSGQKKGKNVLLVLTERLLREEIIIKIKNKKAESVVKALDRLERKMGKKRFRNKFKSITMDNGVEFLDCVGIEKDKRTITFYCHPFCSSERGSNENQNKLIRRHVPKGCSINDYSTKEIQYIENFINNYPRRMYQGKSVNQMKEYYQIE